MADADRQRQSWNAIEARLQEAPVKKLPIAGWGRWWWAAAAVLLLLAAGAWWWQGRSGAGSATSYDLAYKTISTRFGEKRRILLPDSSVVILNSNSELKLPADWLLDTLRQVWLRGEAYFEISKSKQPGVDYFLVHTDRLDVKVLGTKFNVNAYTAQTTVALKEGRVELLYSQRPGRSAAGLRVHSMKPGDVVTVDEGPVLTPMLATAPPDVMADWTSNEYHFDYTSLAEIGRMIEQRYGYEMEFETAALADRTMSGHLRADNLDQLLQALQITLNIKIEKKDQLLKVSVP